MPAVMSAVSLTPKRITEAAATRPGGGMIGIIFFTVLPFLSIIDFTHLVNLIAENNYFIRDRRKEVGL